MPAFNHPGILVTITDNAARIEADSEALREWSRRPGHAWPCSELARLDRFSATFDKGGLIDVDHPPADDVTADELSAFCADSLLDSLSPDHPAFDLAVGQHSEETDIWEAEARQRGRDAGEAAGTWAADGNTPAEGARRLVAMLDDGDPVAYDRLPPAPNLSGEWGSDPTPLSLAREITGMGPRYVTTNDRNRTGEDPSAELIDRLAEAFEGGVNETFEQSCERTLRTAAGLD